MPHGGGYGTPLPRTGVSVHGRTAVPPTDSIAPYHLPVLRFPRLNRTLWFRVLRLAYVRGELSSSELRMGRFLTYQRLGRLSGRIIGRRGYEDADGGMALAERYAAVYDLAPGAFWADLRRMVVAGWVETVVRPAPGRRAVYALALRADAIPHDLPEDLAQALGVHQIPEDVRDEDAAYGRLTARPVPLAEPRTVEVTERQAADLDAAVRWEHPAGSPAALAAAAIAKSARWLHEDERPTPRCTAVAAPVPGQRLAKWLTMYQVMYQPETSPSYAKGSHPCGLKTTGSSGQMFVKEMERTKRTPQRAAGVSSGETVQAVVARLMRRVWTAWRRELGHSRVILHLGTWDDETGTWRHNGRSPWEDLRHALAVALPRSSEGELFEVLTRPMDSAEDVGRVAGARLWKLINSRGTKHQYRQIPPRIAQLRPARDDMSDRQREQMREAWAAGEAVPGAPNPLADAVRAKHRQAEEARRAQVEAERRAAFARWGIEVRELREPEHVMRAEAERLNPPPRPADSHAAALEKARSERRARQAQPSAARRAADDLAAARMRQRLARLGIPADQDPETP